MRRYNISIGLTISALFLFNFFSINAQPAVKISGKVTGTLNNPIAGANVTLMNIATLCTVTNTDGSFLLEHNPTNILKEEMSLISNIFTTKNGIILNQNNVGNVHIEIYSMKGSIVSSLFNGKLDVGSHFFTFPEHLACVPIIIRISQNNVTRHIKHNPLVSNKSTVISTLSTPNNTTGTIPVEYFRAVDTLVIEKKNFYLKKIAIDSYITSVATVIHGLMVPDYEPYMWSEIGFQRDWNNCYNYSNNVLNNKWTQVGYASGQEVKECTCEEVEAAALRDGLELCSSINEILPQGKARIALCVAPGQFKDYHFYREDRNHYWTHKIGKGKAITKDNSGNQITDPEKANRGSYTDFCGYLFSDSDSIQGEGHEKIGGPKGSCESKAPLTGMKVSIMVYSGREDPYFYVNDEETYDKIQSALENVTTITNYSDETVVPSHLGYRGILIQNINNSDLYSDQYIVFNKYVEHNYCEDDHKRKVFAYDPSNLIKRIILEEALVRNVINDEQFYVLSSKP